MSFRKDHQFSLKNKSPKLVHGVDFSSFDTNKLIKLYLETLASGLHGICFSAYEDNQGPGHILQDDLVRRRLDLIKPYIKWVRSFSCIEGNEKIPRIAKDMGIKTLVGAWLSDDLKQNQDEINGLIELAKQGHVDIAAVGNEVLYRGDLTEEQLLEYIHQVKASIPGIPVGYVDAYYEFSERPKVTEACDIILANCYPYWEACPQEFALAHMKQMYQQALEAANGKKVIITETGWPSEGGNFEGAFANKENFIKYFINAIQWSKSEEIELFYFSSFDESWKTGDEGDVGAYWGLWDKNEKIKFKH